VKRSTIPATAAEATTRQPAVRNSGKARESRVTNLETKVARLEAALERLSAAAMTYPDDDQVRRLCGGSQ
jgi:hypothetical protein